MAVSRLYNGHIDRARDSEVRGKVKSQTEKRIDDLEAESGKVPQLIVSVTAPVSGMGLGDYWVEINNTTDKNLEAFYQYQTVSSQNQWVLLYNSAGGGSGVTINISHAILVQQEDVI